MRIVLATICCGFRSWGFVKKLNFCSDFEHKVWSRFWSWSSGKICSWSLATFLRWYFVEVMKLNLGQDLKLGLVKILKFKFSWNAEIWLRFWSWCLVDILEMKFDQNLCKNFDMTKEVILVSRTQPSGPFCLWQCLFLSEMWLPRRCFIVSVMPEIHAWWTKLGCRDRWVDVW